MRYEDNSGLPRWDAFLGELKGGNQISKARKFNKLKLIEETDAYGFYKVLPIPGYNKTTYEVNIFADGCTCQFNKKTGKPCAHIMAVWLFKKLKSNRC